MVLEPAREVHGRDVTPGRDLGYGGGVEACRGGGVVGAAGLEDHVLPGQLAPAVTQGGGRRACRLEGRGLVDVLGIGRLTVGTQLQEAQAGLVPALGHGLGVLPPGVGVGGEASAQAGVVPGVGKGARQALHALGPHVVGLVGRVVEVGQVARAVKPLLVAVTVGIDPHAVHGGKGLQAVVEAGPAQDDGVVESQGPQARAARQHVGHLGGIGRHLVHVPGGEVQAGQALVARKEAGVGFDAARVPARQARELGQAGVVGEGPGQAGVLGTGGAGDTDAGDGGQSGVAREEVLQGHSLGEVDAAAVEGLEKRVVLEPAKEVERHDHAVSGAGIEGVDRGGALLLELLVRGVGVLDQSTPGQGGLDALVGALVLVDVLSAVRVQEADGNPANGGLGPVV